MFNVFTLANGRLIQHEIDDPSALADLQPVWVDLEAPTRAEKDWIQARFGLTIPDDIDDDDLEESARFYEEDNGELHIRSDFLIEGDSDPDGALARNVRVAFILLPQRAVLGTCTTTCRCSACCACARAAFRR